MIRPNGLVYLIIISFSFNSFSQNPTDCFNAIGVCSNSTLVENSNGFGIDDFTNSNNESACLLQGEHQSVWLYIRIESGNNLGFDITPLGTGEDFDFAVYGPNVNCENLGTPIRCSYAGFSCSFCPNTGLNASSTDLSEGLSGDGFVKWLEVIPGDTYFVLIDNFIASDSGFELVWTGDAEATLDCEITYICPTVELGNDTSICLGVVTEIGIGPVPTDTYLWNTGSTESIISVITPGWYWLDVQRNGCSARDSIFISQNPSPLIDIGPDTIVCLGQTFTLDAFNPLATGYLWQDNSTESTFIVDQEGIYSVSVSNNFCTVVDSVIVDYISVPQLNLGIDTQLCNGTTYTILPDVDHENISYLWQDNSTLNYLQVSNNGTYSLTIQNQCAMVSDTIEIGYISCGCKIVLPTAFTPNEDSYNDVYRPIIHCDSLTGFRFEIYNRFGEVVFQTNDVNLGWDAYNMGNDFSMDTYNWFLEYRWRFNEMEFIKRDSGTITLIK